MRKCKSCKAKIVGRTDKLFCSIKCKNNAYQQAKKRTQSITLEVDKILHRNYRILASMMKGEYRKLKIPQLKLAKAKFNFNYITNYQINKQGKVFHYVYDLAWMSFSDNEILIIKQKKD